MNKIISITQCDVNTKIYPEKLSELSERDAKWDLHRKNTQTIESIYDKNITYKSITKRMRECSQILGFASSVNTITGEMGLKLRTAMFCHVRNCPVCGWRRQLNNFRKAMERLPDIQSEHGGRWIFLTLTVKNPPMSQLRVTLKKMTAAWSKLSKRKHFPALGFVRATEITRGTDSRPHPHFHILLHVSNNYFSRNYWSKEKWAAEWEDVMKLDYSPVVDVRIIKPKLGQQGGNALVAAAAETIKYAVKVEDLMSDADFLYGITDALHKLRFIGTGGTCQGLLKDEITQEEMIGVDEDSEEVAEDPRPSIFYGWNREKRHYRKSNLL